MRYRYQTTEGSSKYPKYFSAVFPSFPSVFCMIFWAITWTLHSCLAHGLLILKDFLAVLVQGQPGKSQRPTRLIGAFGDIIRNPKHLISVTKHYSQLKDKKNKKRRGLLYKHLSRC
jgi:hypothetical protein